MKHNRLRSQTKNTKRKCASDTEETDLDAEFERGYDSDPSPTEDYTFQANPLEAHGLHSIREVSNPKLDGPEKELYDTLAHDIRAFNMLKSTDYVKKSAMGDTSAITMQNAIDHHEKTIESFVFVKNILGTLDKLSAEKGINIQDKLAAVNQLLSGIETCAYNMNKDIHKMATQASDLNGRGPSQKGV